MKITLVQQNYIVGDTEGNKVKIIAAIEQAKLQGAELAVFPELSVSGYPPLDLLSYPSFIEHCKKAADEIALACNGIAAIIGLPVHNEELKGKKLRNAAFLLQDGKVSDIVYKSLLPTYDIFDEYRYFEPARNTKIVLINGKKIALTICEDLWAEDAAALYGSSPMQQLCSQNPEMIINIAASPFSYEQAETRKIVLTGNALKYKLPILYVNQVGAHTDLVFDGDSMFMDASGKIIHQLNLFKEEIRTIDTSADSGIIQQNLSKTELIHDALVLGIADYFKKMGFKKAILGLSGGVDSAIVGVLAQRALGSENVLAILLPSKFSSDHSISDAEQLAQNLGIEYHTMPIQGAYEAHMQTLAPLFKDLPFNLAEENLQARVRGTLLMALSNKFGHILLNTTNKSEMAVGYGTLYGDMCGGISVLGDVYKMEVYELGGFINKSQEVIPSNILTKAPSAELRPDQKDSDSLPEYPVLDAILYQYIEKAASAEEISMKGFEETLVRRVLRLVNMNEYKRFQAAPVLRVSPKAFGRGRVMPLVAKY